MAVSPLVYRTLSRVLTREQQAELGRVRQARAERILRQYSSQLHEAGRQLVRHTAYTGACLQRGAR